MNWHKSCRVAAVFVATALAGYSTSAAAPPAAQNLSATTSLQAVAFPAAQASSQESKGAVHNEADGSALRSEQEALLLTYMDLYYASLAALQAQDPGALFAPDAQEQAATRKGVWQTIIAVRCEQPVDLSLSDYSYELVLTEISEEGGVVSVSARENATQVFALTPGTKSRSFETRHQFSMTLTGGEWRLLSHRQMDMANMLAAGRTVGRPGSSQPQPSAAQARDQLATRRAELLSVHREQLAARAKQGQTSSAAAFRHDWAYDRESAVDYAMQWAGKRNAANWPTYDRSGGNCQNYTSQCLFAGGIPMDYTGSSQWKWFGASPDTSQTATGRSGSWSSVSGFYAYASRNTGYGLVAETDASFWSGEPGDLVQLGYEDNWRHVVIIVDVVRGADGDAVDYLINSNTADLRSFPLSTYLYPQQRLIKIYGWNDSSV